MEYFPTPSISIGVLIGRKYALWEKEKTSLQKLSASILEFKLDKLVLSPPLSILVASDLRDLLNWFWEEISLKSKDTMVLLTNL